MKFVKYNDNKSVTIPADTIASFLKPTVNKAEGTMSLVVDRDAITKYVTSDSVTKELTVPKVTQYYYEVRPKNKGEVLSRLLDIYDPKLSVVFCNTKKGVDELVQELQGRGYFAEGLHGDS